MLKELFYFTWMIIGRLIKNQKESKSILFVKLDALGDLFIFLSAAKGMDIKKISIMLNHNHKEIIEYLGLEFKQAFYFDKKKFYKNPMYTYEILKTISKYSIFILRPKSNRYLEEIFFSTQTRKIQNFQKRYIESQYRQIRNNLKTVGNLTTKITENNTKDILRKEKNYVLISPFTSDSRREVDIRKLIRTAKQHFPDNPIIICVENDEQSQSLKKKTKGNKIVITKNVIAFIEAVKNSMAVISNDSAAGHISLFYGKPTVVFLGGGQPKEFYPYGSEEIDCNLTLISNQPECAGCDWECIKPLNINKFQCIQDLC